MPAFGLDIGSSSLKLIEAAAAKPKPRLITFGLAVNPVPDIETGDKNEQVKLAEAIVGLMKEAGVSSKKAVLALPEQKVYTRVVEMPVLTDAELASAINWEAEQYIPIPISEVQLDYRIISRPKAATPDARMQVFLVAAPNSTIQKLLNILDLAGIEAQALETEVLGLARALVPAGPPYLPVLVIHLGAETTDFTLVEGGVVIFTRSVQTGGSAFSRGLANELGLELTQAEQYKRTYGLDGKQLAGKVRAALLPFYNVISDEARKAIYYYTSTRTAKISRVILSGGGAYMPELTGALAKDLSLEVVVGTPFGNLTTVDKQLTRIGAIAAVFSVAVGLALRGI